MNTVTYCVVDSSNDTRFLKKIQIWHNHFGALEIAQVYKIENCEVMDRKKRWKRNVQMLCYFKFF